MDAGNKQAARRKARQRRRELTRGFRAEASAAITRSVTDSEVWRAATVVGLFSSIRTEVATGALLDAARAIGKRVALPVVVAPGEPMVFRDVSDVHAPLATRRWGVAEPTDACPLVPLAELDLVLCPGLCFDRHGGRLGYGGGFYDRTFAGQRAARWLLAFAVQEVDRVPMAPHDLRLHGVFTEAERLHLR